MTHSFKALSASEQKRVFSLLKKDIRVRELNKTAKVRPLNILEQIMLEQLVQEAINGTL